MEKSHETGSFVSKHDARLSKTADRLGMRVAHARTTSSTCEMRRVYGSQCADTVLCIWKQAFRPRNRHNVGMIYYVGPIGEGSLASKTVTDYSVVNEREST